MCMDTVSLEGANVAGTRMTGAVVGDANQWATEAVDGTNAVFCQGFGSESVLCLDVAGSDMPGLSPTLGVTVKNGLLKLFSKLELTVER